MSTTTRRAAVVLLLTLGGAGALSSQTADAQAQVAALHRLDRWVGEWSGSGWSVNQQGVRVTFDQRERVERMVGGTVLLVVGHGTSRNAAGAEITTHDGLVLVTYDPATDRYRWRGRELNRAEMDAEVTLIPGGFSWQIPAGPATTVRFTIQLDDHEWREWGEVRSDGSDWSRFMEVTLRRQPASNP